MIGIIEPPWYVIRMPGGVGFLLPTNIVVHCNFLTTHIFSISFND